LRSEHKLRFLPDYAGQITLGPRKQSYFVLGWPLHKLLAIQGTSGLAQSAWPTARGDAGNTGLGRGPVRLEDPELDRTTFRFKVQTIPRNTYQLQASPSLEQPQWMSVNSIEGDGSKRIVTDPEPSGAARFYRVQITPTEFP
jgi:hypothetical protein